jgi:cold shock CspA family protein/ribosome-associated translation inhibitor RaiA
MQLPPQIVLRHVPRSETLRLRVEALVRRLERFAPRMTACRVHLARPNLRHHKGNRYRVRIDVTLPGQEVVVRRDPPAHRSHEDVRSALREAFDAARRRIEDTVRRRRGDVKQHAVPLHGRVLRLDRLKGYGFLRAADGHVVYFHRRSLVGRAFGRVQVGEAVTFDEEPGDEGDQARWVRVSRERPTRTERPRASRISSERTREGT